MDAAAKTLAGFWTLICVGWFAWLGPAKLDCGDNHRTILNPGRSERLGFRNLRAYPAPQTHIST